MRWTFALISAAVWSLMAMPINAYPIAPVGLIELCERSDVIVVAIPGSMTRIARSDDSWNSAKVELEIIHVVKGQPGNGPMTVHAPQLVCPAPPYYPKGERVLAFLSESKLPGVYETVGLSYGTRTVTDKEAAAFVKRIKELLAIFALADTKLHAPCALEWTVCCAEDPVLRYDAVSVLCRDGYVRLSSNRDEEYEVATHLSRLQKQRLLDVLLKADGLEYGAVQLAKLVEDLGDKRPAAHLMRRLMASDLVIDSRGTGFFRFESEAMEYIAKVERSEKGQSIARMYRELKPEDVEPRRALLRRFVRVLDYVAVDYQAPTRLDPATVTGVPDAKHDSPATGFRFRSPSRPRAPSATSP